ncbi:MAG: hypothetical protein NC111_00165 [Bacteroides sp.]|nr:hypothetical protein [Bacteroides sp.]MCM1412775.1 hypothetical protein [Bacteroides sp.]MCM1470931.1 hypothetical protein [Bacteroides sp.]
MPDRNLKVALIPLDIVAFDPKANVDILKQRLATIDKDTDLIVVPEMFTSGYTPDFNIVARIAERPEKAVIPTLVRWCRDNKKALWGTLTATDGDGFVNRGFMIDDLGRVSHYDKRHLFSYGGEDKTLRPGRLPSPTIEYRSWRIRMAICYDIRFPVWNRARMKDYDALIVPANWAHTRAYAWHQMLIARAIENQIYVLGCNRTGSDFYGSYNADDTVAYDDWGKPTGRRAADGTLYVELDAKKLNADRDRFTPWADADNFIIEP